MTIKTSHDLTHGWTLDIFSHPRVSGQTATIRHDSGERIDLSEASLNRLREILRRSATKDDVDLDEESERNADASYERDEVQGED